MMPACAGRLKGSVTMAVDAPVSITRLDCPQTLVGESPRWDAARQCLTYVDIFGELLCQYHPSSNEYRSWPMGEKIGFWVPTPSGNYLMGGEKDIFWFNPETETRKPFLPFEADNPATRANDARCDANGRLWVTTMAIAGEPRPPVGSLYCVEPDGGITQWVRDLSIANSVGFSKDNKHLYLSDTTPGTMWRYALDLKTAKISNQQDYYLPDPPGKPDGACLDNDGFMWLAIPGAGQVHRLAPDGQLDRVVDLPCEHPTMCGFGGDDLSTLYVTSLSRYLDDAGRRKKPDEGALFAIETDVSGVPENMFGSANG